MLWNAYETDSKTKFEPEYIRRGLNGDAVDDVMDMTVNQIGLSKQGLTYKQVSPCFKGRLDPGHRGKAVLFTSLRRSARKFKKNCRRLGAMYTRSPNALFRYLRDATTPTGYYYQDSIVVSYNMDRDSCMVESGIETKNWICG
jgi:hypothetical protein